MDPAASQINYQDVLSEFIHRQTLILGPYITLAKVAHVPGVTVDPKGYVKKIDGDAQKLLEEVVAQFKPLSEFLVKSTLSVILSQHQSLTHFDANMPAVKTHDVNQLASLPQAQPVSHPAPNPINSATKPEKQHRFGWFGKANPDEVTKSELNAQKSQ